MKNEQPHLSSGKTVGEEMPTEHGQPSETRLWSFQKPRQAPRAWEGLRITVFEVDENQPLPNGVPKLDWIWYSGFAVIVVQLALASVPWALHDQWGTFMITLAGTVLALIGGSLPQWYVHLALIFAIFW